VSRAKAKKFVRSIERAIDESPKHNRCDQCEALVINGLYCHESGCPNTNKRLIDGEWHKIRTCRECGSQLKDDEVCCEADGMCL
jgi:hypothetical protein